MENPAPGDHTVMTVLFGLKQMESGINLIIFPIVLRHFYFPGTAVQVIVTLDLLKSALVMERSPAIATIENINCQNSVLELILGKYNDSAIIPNHWLPMKVIDTSLAYILTKNVNFSSVYEEKAALFLCNILSFNTF